MVYYRLSDTSISVLDTSISVSDISISVSDISISVSDTITACTYLTCHKPRAWFRVVTRVPYVGYTVRYWNHTPMCNVLPGYVVRAQDVCVCVCVCVCARARVASAHLCVWIRVRVCSYVRA